jgi:NADPH:quinone reductase-like Zn-dependent oxidoreductase
MKAVMYTQYGSADVLQISEVEKPIPADNEVLIKIHATTVASTDAIFRAGSDFMARMFTGLIKPKPTIPGGSFAGEIEAVGKEVKRFQVGDQVFGTADPDTGAHAEYLNLPEDRAIALKPAHMTYEEAVAIHPGALTALPNLQGAAYLQAGEKILIIGASGSIGSSAVQLAKHFGADVTGVCSTANVEMVKSLGADKVIDYKKEDYSRSGETYDVVFDTVGKSSFGQARRVLKPGGLYLSTIISLDLLLHMLWTSKFGSKKAKIVFAGLRPSSEKNGYLSLLLELVETGRFKPVIDRCYSLEQIAEAHRYVETGRKKGNVVIAIMPQDTWIKVS